MYKISNFSDNDDVKIIDKSGPFEVIEYQRDLSVMPEDAQLAFFCSQMNVRKRQLKCELSRGNVTIQSGAMQWMAGDVFLHIVFSILIIMYLLYTCNHIISVSL